MIVAKLMGGLGNQMFCYAAARRLAYRHRVSLKLDLSDYRLGSDQRPKGLEAFSRQLGIFNFNVSAAEATAEEIAAVRDPFVTSSWRDRIVRQVRRIYPRFLWPCSDCREKSYRFDEDVLKLRDDCYLSGFWQSEKYFIDSAEVIREEFTIRDAKIHKYAADYISELKGQSNRCIVSLHVRRGDLAYAAETLERPLAVHSPTVSLDYIHAAIDRFDERDRFLVFSDSAADLDWCRRNIVAKDIYFSEGHSDIVDFALMSACDHHIIANSTFSWWAAWLSGKRSKRVVAPLKWFSSLGRPDLVIDDLIPADWETL